MVLAINSLVKFKMGAIDSEVELSIINLEEEHIINLVAMLNIVGFILLIINC